MTLVRSTIYDPLEPLERLNRLDSLDFWDRLRHWRALDYFDTLVPSFFQPLFPPSSIIPRPREIIRSKSMSQLNVSHEIVSKDGFQVQLDVCKFKPNQVEVRIINDVIVVEGKQSEQWDNTKTTTRSFTHRYSLPLGYDPWQVNATLSTYGILTIKAPPPSRGLAKCTRRFVPIKQI